MELKEEFSIKLGRVRKLMEEKGLIRRTSLEADGRYKSIELEPEGLKLQKLGAQIEKVETDRELQKFRLKIG